MEKKTQFYNESDSTWYDIINERTEISIRGIYTANCPSFSASHRSLPILIELLHLHRIKTRVVVIQQPKRKLSKNSNKLKW